MTTALRIASAQKEEVVLPDHAEFELAKFFTELHGLSRKYVAKWGRWLSWDGRRWVPDDTLATFDLVRECCRERALIVDSDKIATAIASAKTVSAIERLARADRLHAVTPEFFDADPLLLNTPAGTVDLRTGKLREPDRNDFLTKLTAVSPDHDADDSAWAKFLSDVTLGRKDLQDYFARLIGYCLTGDIRDHILPFFLGTGANGKSTLLELVLYIMGDYARQVPSEILMEARGERHPTDIANFLGVRLAVASEVDEGQAWAESRIKSLTGDETMTARFMRQDFFTFRRTHKLIVAGNHRPGLRAVDEAMRRRIHLVPFDARFIGDAVDRDMPAKLRREAPAILAWAVRGALDWQANGLCPPGEVRGATDEYLAAEDTLGAWIDEACITSDPDARTTSSALYKSFRAWKDRRGERAPTQKRFSAQLEQRYRKKRTGGNVWFFGIQLRAPRN